MALHAPNGSPRGGLAVDGRAPNAYTRVILDSSREMRERVAQPVEHLTFNQEVMGSNPIALTI